MIHAVKRFAWPVLLFAAFSFAVLNLDNIPYFFQWDTDSTVFIDTLLLNSGKLPEHVNHPSFGLYLVTSIYIRLVSFFSSYNVVSTIDNLAKCSDISLCVKNSVYALRLIPSVIVFCFWVGATYTVFKSTKSLLITIAVLALVTADPSLYYNTFFIKSEIFSFAFFSLSAYILFSFNKSRIWKYAAFGLAGLCLLTKLQYVFYYIALMLIFSIKHPIAEISNKSSRGVNLGIFVLLVLLLLGYFTAPLDKFGGWGQSVLTPLCAALILLPIVAYYFGMYYKNKLYWPAIASPISLLIASITSILIFSPWLGVSFAADALGMAFFRTPSQDYSDFSSINKFLPFMVFMWLALFYIVIRLLIETKVSVVSLSFIPLCVLNFFIVYRGSFRDVFPATWLTIFTVIGGLVLFGRHLNKIDRLVMVFFIGFAIYALPYTSLNSRYIAMSENLHYGFNPGKFFGSVYDGNQSYYHNIVKYVDYNSISRDYFTSNKAAHIYFPNANSECLNSQNFSRNADEFIELTSNESSIVAALSKGYKVYKFTRRCTSKANITPGWTKNENVITPKLLISSDGDQYLEIFPPYITFATIGIQGIPSYRSAEFYEFKSLEDSALYKSPIVKIGSNYSTIVTNKYGRFNYGDDGIIFVIFNDVL